jgi:hypothetical protein
MRWYSFIAVVTLLVGCAKYEYKLVQPGDLARHIGKQIEHLSIDPLEYRLQSYEGRLVMQIFNATQGLIQLDGTRSVAVDQDGQSHPLRSQTMAPGSFIKLIYPPALPRIQRVGPSFRVGVGVGARAERYDGPYYLDFYDAGDATYWDWTGETEVRLTLVFQGEKTFTHQFVFRRQKV